MIKKYKFSDNYCTFKGKRNYLHSTNIFDQILNIIDKDFSEIEISFKKKINFKPIIIISDKICDFKKNSIFVEFFIKKKSKLTYGYLIKSNRKITQYRKYNEKKFQKSLIFNKDIILIKKRFRLSFIEKVTSAAMSFLNTKTQKNEKTKWYLVKINFIFSKNIEQCRDLKLLIKKKSLNFFVFDILQKKKIGSMLFLKK